MTQTLLARRLLSAVALLLWLAVPTTAHAAFPGGNGRIAFERPNKADDFDLVSVSPSGRAERSLGVGDGVAYSADGQRIAFAARPSDHSDQGPDDESASIYVASDGSARRLVTTNGFNPDWSPDGRSLVFEREEEPGTEVGLGSSNILVVGTDGGASREIASQGESPRWSPDGRLIAFLGGEGAEVVRPDGRGRAKLTPYPEAFPRSRTTSCPSRISTGRLTAARSSSLETSTLGASKPTSSA